jgi:hypothetical protein
VSVFTAANAPSEFIHAVSLATSRASDTCVNGEPQHVTQPSTVAMPLPSARVIPTRPNASDKFHSAPDNMYLSLLPMHAFPFALTVAPRVFSSLLGQGVACQWIAASALTFVSPPHVPSFACGVFFDGRFPQRLRVDQALTSLQAPRSLSPKRMCSHGAHCVCAVLGSR